jgi:hypothetical protein
MSIWTHVATGILLVPAILVAMRIKGVVKPAYRAVDVRRPMSASFNCESRGLSR